MNFYLFSPPTHTHTSQLIDIINNLSAWNVLMNIYFTLCVIIQYYYVYFVGQSVLPLAIGTLSWLLWHFDTSPSPHHCEIVLVCFLEHFFTFFIVGIIKNVPYFPAPPPLFLSPSPHRLILYISYSSPRIGHFSKELYLFLLERNTFFNLR